MDLMQEIFAAYDRCRDEQDQVLNAVLTCITPPTEAQKKGMEAFLCRKYRAKKADITCAGMTRSSADLSFVWEVTNTTGV